MVDIKKIILYTIGCPNCERLEEKLNAFNIKHEVCEDRELMTSKGITHSPVLEVDNVQMSFKEAMKWVNEQRKETI